MKKLREEFGSTPEDLTDLIDWLLCWLSRHLAIASFQWLEQKRQQISQGASGRIFFTAFSAVPRYTGKEDLTLTPEDWQEAEKVRSGWFPCHWSIDQAARTLLVLSLPTDGISQYLSTLEQVFNAADVGELVTLYQALPLLPYPDQHRQRAAEGVRSNMTSVFNAIALRNPYPCEYFDDLAWNQMILKTLFVGSPLNLIQGLEGRANAELARMLVDYAHERWAAHRSVSPELWRLVGQFADFAILEDLERVLAAPDPTEQAAAALACAECPLPQAQALLDSYPTLKTAIASGKLTWNHLQMARQ